MPGDNASRVASACESMPVETHAWSRTLNWSSRFLIRPSSWLASSRPQSTFSAPGLPALVASTTASGTESVSLPETRTGARRVKATAAEMSGKLGGRWAAARFEGILQDIVQHHRFGNANIAHVALTVPFDY